MSDDQNRYDVGWVDGYKAGLHDGCQQEAALKRLIDELEHEQLADTHVVSSDPISAIVRNPDALYNGRQVRHIVLTERTVFNLKFEGQQALADLKTYTNRAATAATCPDLAWARSFQQGYDSRINDAMTTFTGLSRQLGDPPDDQFLKLVGGYSEGVQRLTRMLDRGEYLRNVVSGDGNEKIQALSAAAQARIDTWGRPKGMDPVLVYIAERGIALRNENPGMDDHHIVILLVNSLGQSAATVLEKEALRRLKRWKYNRRGRSLSSLIGRYQKDESTKRVFVD